MWLYLIWGRCRRRESHDEMNMGSLVQVRGWRKFSGGRGGEVFPLRAQSPTLTTCRYRKKQR